MRNAARNSLLLDRRRRGHLALLSAVLLVSVFGYLLLQPRTVHVLADGQELTLRTHSSSDAAVLAGTGIDVRPGDRVTTLDRGGADVIRIERAHEVMLTVDGMRLRIQTQALTIDQLLDEAGVALATRDSVLQNGALVASNAPMRPPVLFVSLASAAGRGESDVTIGIEVRRAVTLTIIDDDREFETTSSRQTVALALREAGVNTGPGDVIVPPPDSVLADTGRIEVRRARALTVALPDDHQVLYTLARTVGEALSAAGISVPEGSFILPSAETPVTAGMSVRVVQLSGSNKIEREFIENDTVYRLDAALSPGETRTEQGHDGALVRRYDVSYVDGAEAGRELIDEYYDPEPADTVIYYPPQSGREEPAPAAPEGSARTLRVYATYYTPASAGRDPSDPAYGITATGATVTYGIVAVDPTVIPLGTRMFIPGYGYAVAADTGGAVKGYIVDLGYPDGVTIDWTPGWLDIYILS